MTTLAEFPPLIPHHHPPSIAGRLNNREKKRLVIAGLPQSPGGLNNREKKTFVFQQEGKKFPEAGASGMALKVFGVSVLAMRVGHVFVVMDALDGVPHVAFDERIEVAPFVRFRVQPG